MTMSPASMRRGDLVDDRAGDAAGTITHAARGGVSFATKSSSDARRTAPRDSSCATASGFTS